MLCPAGVQKQRGMGAQGEPPTCLSLWWLAQVLDEQLVWGCSTHSTWHSRVSGGQGVGEKEGGEQQRKRVPAEGRRPSRDSRRGGSKVAGPGAEVGTDKDMGPPSARRPRSTTWPQAPCPRLSLSVLTPCPLAFTQGLTTHRELVIPVPTVELEVRAGQLVQPPLWLWHQASAVPTRTRPLRKREGPGHAWPPPRATAVSGADRA